VQNDWQNEKKFDLRYQFFPFSEKAILIYINIRSRKFNLDGPDGYNYWNTPEFLPLYFSKDASAEKYVMMYDLDIDLDEWHI
jgi:hypothetical protein